MKTIYNVVNSSVEAPGYYTVAGQVPDLVEWNGKYDPGYETFFVNWDILHPATEQINGYAILFESKSLMPMVYEQLENNLDRFKLVFTPDSYLVENIHINVNGFLQEEFGLGVLMAKVRLKYSRNLK